MTAITICKFFNNTSINDQHNKVISRTLRKIAVIDRRWTAVDSQHYPKDGEFWKVGIVREFGRAMKGCFLVHPLQKIHDNEFRSLIPGTYDIEAEDGLVVLTPHNPGYWVMPIEHRQILIRQYNAYAVIIDIQKFEETIDLDKIYGKR